MPKTKKILVVGSSGYLGRVITERLSGEYSPVCTHHQNSYFLDSIPYSFPDDDLSQLVKTHRIDTCIFPAEIEKNQVDHELDDLDCYRRKVREVVQAVSGTRFVYISSDGIFDGRQGLYAETDVPQPKTEYGRKLKICEDIIRTYCSNYCIIRPSYLYGYALGILDNRLQRTKNLCRGQQEAIYFNDMFKSPLHVVDAAKLIITLTLSEFVGVIHIGGPRMSVFDFHKEAMRAMGVSGQITSNTMPIDAGLLRDTSLNVALCTELTGFTPLSVTQSFSQYFES